MKLSAFRGLFSLPAAMFYCLTTGVMHDRVNSPPGIPAFTAILASILLPGSVALWVLADAQKERRSLPYDFGSFVFFAWWALVPIYLFSTRGWRGFIPPRLVHSALCGSRCPGKYSGLVTCHAPMKRTGTPNQ